MSTAYDVPPDMMLASFKADRGSAIGSIWAVGWTWRIVDPLFHIKWTNIQCSRSNNGSCIRRASESAQKFINSGFSVRHIVCWSLGAGLVAV